MLLSLKHQSFSMVTQEEEEIKGIYIYQVSSQSCRLHDCTGQEEHRRDCLRVSLSADTLDELALQVYTRNSSLVTPNTFYTLFTNPSYSTQNLRILVSIKPYTQEA